MIRTSVLLLSVGLLAVPSADAEKLTKVRPDRYEGEPIVKTFGVAGTENLSFTSSSYLHGSLTVRATDRRDVRVSIKSQFKAGSLQEAEEFSDYLSVSFEDLENEFSISAETRSAPPWRGSDASAGVEVIIEAPETANLKIFARTSMFSIDIDGPFAAVDLNSTFGDITVREVSNKVNVNCDNGAVTVTNCSGPTKVTTSNRPIVLRNIDAQLGTIRLRNENGRIDIDSVRGEIDARTEFAQITASAIRLESSRSTLSTDNANIRLDLEAVSGDLVLRNENGNIDLTIPTTASVGLFLHVEEGGRIYTSNLPIAVDRVSRTALQGRIGSGQNKIEVDLTGVGTITLEGMDINRLSNR